MQQWDVVIVGAGIAGVTAARTVAERAGEKTVLLVNGEQPPPYRRTKVSKTIVDGFDPEYWRIESEPWNDHQHIELRSGTTAKRLLPDEHRIELSDGEQIEYRSLILATGAAPRFPPVVRPHEEGTFYVVRSADDVARLGKDLKRGKRVLVAGIGVLGVEVAEQLRKLKKQVTMVGTAPQVMPRQLNARAGEILEDLLRSSGAKLHFQEEILSFEKRGKGGVSVSMIRQSGAFDAVVFCIGVKPRVELAAEAGISTDVGVIVDEELRTSADDVFAAGDVAQHPDGLVTGLWHSAEHQGEVAAINALGGSEVAHPRAFRLKCEVFGSYFFSMNKPANELAYEIDEMEVGDRYRCLYFDNHELTGAIVINDRDRADLYTQAVREAWSRERVESELPFS